MGGPRGAGWVAAGLLLGAGACYCIYRLTRGRRRGDRELGIRSSKSAGALEEGTSEGQLCGRSARPQTGGTWESQWSKTSQPGVCFGNGNSCLRETHPPSGQMHDSVSVQKLIEDLTDGSYDDVLNAEQLQKLLYLLESTEDPVIIERALITLGNNAAFSVNQAIIRELGGIPIVANKINHSNQSIKEKALNALNNLSVNVENQIKIKVQVLKLLLNLSENPAMTEGLLRAQVDSSFLSLYDSHVAKEILLRVLTLFQNIKNCLKIEGHLAVQPTFTEGSLFFLLHGEECAQKIRALVDHHDAEVKEKVVTIIPKI
ncbi:armadillo repeat-containing protein 10 isoform X9 [Homo sapiens]|uniref:armadillo repeat-containing protein 10 isoform X9 n=1 Tax=Homo sapiens TaxID=9606 RepID=UPI001FB10512|nr:armadillo repeat-containing protein 10 isoform X9 [Homo sapiens]XP_054215139.1 armadillo repeat-containing protein 10 isoform X9 [Homo sapiens]